MVDNPMYSQSAEMAKDVLENHYLFSKENVKYGGLRFGINVGKEYAGQTQAHAHIQGFSAGNVVENPSYNAFENGDTIFFPGEYTTDNFPIIVRELQSFGEKIEDANYNIVLDYNSENRTLCNIALVQRYDIGNKKGYNTHVSKWLKSKNAF